MADDNKYEFEAIKKLMREHNKELNLTDKEIEFILNLRELDQDNLEAVKTCIAKECLKSKSMN